VASIGVIRPGSEIPANYLACIGRGMYVVCYIYVYVRYHKDRSLDLNYKGNICCINKILNVRAVARDY